MDALSCVIFPGLLHLRLAMTVTPATFQNVHVIKISASNLVISRHCEGFSPEAIRKLFLFTLNLALCYFSWIASPAARNAGQVELGHPQKV